MTGILLFGVAITWLISVLAVTRWVAQRFASIAMKVCCSLVLVPTLMAAPLADELIGRQQFESLCKKYAVQVIDEQHAMNRRVVFILPKRDQFVEGAAVQIRIDPNVYLDAETNQVLVSYHTLHASGGWLIRMLGISETNAPLLFRSGCAPENQDAFKKKFNITVIN